MESSALPTVSVVIPVFNGERFIAAAIQSVLHQTFRDFEIIVVDDGSTDATESIVGQFSGSLSYHRQENCGVGVARNLGVECSKGEWIAFLDADDVWYPTKLADQLYFTSTHGDCSFVYSDMDIIDLDGSLVQRSCLSAKIARRKKQRDLINAAFNGGPFPYPSTVLLKRELFLKAGGFYPLFRHNYHEDFELFARIAHDIPLRFMGQSLVKYRRAPKRKTVGGSSEENWRILLTRLAELWRDDAERLELVKWLLDKHSSDEGKDLLRSGDWVNARNCFQMVFWRRPFYFKNLRRLGLSYLPYAREFYGRRKSRDRAG